MINEPCNTNYLYQQMWMNAMPHHVHRNASTLMDHSPVAALKTNMSSTLMEETVMVRIKILVGKSCSCLKFITV